MTTTKTPTNQIAPSGIGVTPRTGRRSWWWLSALLLLGIAWAYWIRGEAESDEFASRRQEIQNMPEAERERLKRNFERFQNLSPEKQEALRKIDRAVDSNGELEATLLTYDRWLNSLTPWQRQELRSAASTADRILLVQSINADRQRQQEEYERQQREYAEQDKEYQELVKKYLPSNQGRRPEGKRLSDEHVKLMMCVLDEEYAKKVKLKKNSLPGEAARNLELLAVALRANIEKKGLEAARETPLPEETIQSMIHTIDDPELREQTQGVHKERGARGFVGYLNVKLQFSWWNEARRHFPPQSELEELAETLGGEALKRFEETKAKNPRQAYWDLVVATRPATFRIDAKSLFDALEELNLKQSIWRPHGSGRRRGRGSRDHDNDDDRDRDQFRKKFERSDSSKPDDGDNCEN